ncbi:glycosyltransferase family 4 protein [Bacillus timonensis]|uniref:glycosyltransferase family 4 protein n=1 Tax=Bacillus timonensis TaxID=1033734 RepID=UPI0002897BE7|nr:glycosyltransferase family 4 protein [Bacillus timonensis]
MFKFKFVIGGFQNFDLGLSYGPNVKVAMWAKWLSLLAPKDIEIAFAPPNINHRPMFPIDNLKIVRQNEKGWWNHYLFDSSIPNNAKWNWSVGPNHSFDDDAKLLKVAKKNNIPMVAVSDFHREKIIKGYNYDPGLVFTIPNMVDRDIFTTGDRAEKTTVGWIGYDEPYGWIKGKEVIPYLAKRFPDVQFEMIFAKKPSYKVDLPNIKVYSEIPHTHMSEIIKKWHILVCGSKYESGATHIVEAMACGVPVIAADVGAIPEVASSQFLLSTMKTDRDNNNNWSNESLEKYRWALERLLTDKQLYNRLVKDAITESEKADPLTVSELWFKFIYFCQGNLVQ